MALLFDFSDEEFQGPERLQATQATDFRVRRFYGMIEGKRRPMAKDYVESVEGAYRVAGSRVSLYSIVHCFGEGLSPESIVESFPSLTLEQVYGAIAFYLANQPMVDEYLREGEKLSHELQAESRRRNADVITRLQRARHESQIPG